MKILVAEDSPVNQRVLNIILKQLGHETEFASDGGSAVQMYKKNQHDIIFMDENMPEMNGIEATSCIRKISCNETHPYIVALTASEMKISEKNYIELGMNEYLSKPVFVENIKKAIEDFAALNS